MFILKIKKTKVIILYAMLKFQRCQFNDLFLFINFFKCIKSIN